MPIHVMLACNHHRNGVFAGKLDALELVDWDCRGDIALSIEGPPLRMGKEWGRGYFARHEAADDAIGRIKVDQVEYPVLRYETWVGNWCWDQASMRLVHVAQLLEQLRAAHWSIDHGLREFWDVWANPEPIPAQMARLGRGAGRGQG